MNLIGYSQYSPTKHAIRSLAETLHQELQPYQIDVHIYYVSTILTPGYLEERTTEEKTKPAITKIIEGTEISDASPDARAKTLIDGTEITAM
ncbi:hypothetical protein O9G_001024 [Rozella allomycis CSF55]|uniref:NAD(P)-binding domain-containing protein n=1 Tax=Rozella allomycis (strain CSF55) TaxID=988480 RepID=A0A075AN25_ROZAC|nr:hypothetical protein O9G_001024 [Rozella allomycis CSF55]|eukprot:EPZ31113.1 hypothetical protein O9G_001024 [Rozella allomycis CSF55]